MSVTGVGASVYWISHRQWQGDVGGTQPTFPDHATNTPSGGAAGSNPGTTHAASNGAPAGSNAGDGDNHHDKTGQDNDAPNRILPPPQSVSAPGTGQRVNIIA